MTETPPTLRYLGTDHHSRKVIEGKFMSNVGPRNFGRDRLREDDWFCDCGDIHRSYLVRCTKCGITREEARVKYGQ